MKSPASRMMGVIKWISMLNFYGGYVYEVFEVFQVFRGFLIVENESYYIKFRLGF